MVQAISMNSVNYNYSPLVPEAHRALKDVKLVIPVGSLTAVVGRTGSGKSTLMQLCDALLRPASGSIRVGNVQIDAKTRRRKLQSVHRQVGIVFQDAAAQLFGPTVADDLAFALRNFGIRHVAARVKRVLQLVGLPAGYLHVSPFDLSGGQAKRVAIGSVLVYRPRILLFDEPTVGLDYQGQCALMRLLNKLHRQSKLTIVMVTHRMSLVAKYATSVIVMDRGRILAKVTPRALFSNQKLLKRAGLLEPFAPHFYNRLKKKGFQLPHVPLSVNDLARELTTKLKSQMKTN